ncbi:MAG: hypothetical protein U5R48_06715 [Gammaproteobacteria bacterium]|nr:hypothetical protein [Gammaproteobacteria bacterium]
MPRGCIEYRFDLSAAERAQADSRVRRVGRDLLVSPDLWLWLPEPDARQPAGPQGVDVRLEPEPGVSISVPWPELAPASASGGGRYRMQPGPAGWRPLVAIGEFRIHRVPVGDGVLRLAVLDGNPAANEADMIEWLGDAARSLLTVTPAFPVPSPQVLVVPVTGSGRSGDRAPTEAVPFARVLRDGGTAVQFLVDPRRSLADLQADWTAAHEFAHLLLPFVSRSDAWISEGFASYYQNVLRARSGRLEAREAWQRLHEGFERGRRDGYRNTLRESVRNGGENRTMRMYWSGAAVALLADLELRRLSEGRTSLDSVLAAFAACCLPSRRSWEGRELFERLDALSGTEVFTRLFDRHADSTRFPDLAGAYEGLGLEVDGDRIELVDAPRAALRDAIMAPRTAGGARPGS